MEVVRTTLLAISFFEESYIPFGFTLEPQYIQIAGARFMRSLRLNKLVAKLLSSAPMLAMKKLRPLPPLPMGECSSSSQLRTRNEPPIQCASRSSSAPHPPDGKHCTMRGIAHEATTQQSWGPDGLMSARKASPLYPTLCKVTSFPEMAATFVPHSAAVKLRPHGRHAIRCQAFCCCSCAIILHFQPHERLSFP